MLQIRLMLQTNNYCHIKRINDRLHKMEWKLEAKRIKYNNNKDYKSQECHFVTVLNLKMQNELLLGT